MPSYKFFILAPGRVGQAIGKLLQQKNHTCIGVWSRRAESANRAAELLQTTAYHGALPTQLKEAEVVFVTPPERVVASLTEAAAPLLSANTTVLHTAGSLPPTKLDASRKLHSGALHPLQSIASAEDGIRQIPGSFMAVSGDAVARQLARQLAQDMGGEPVQINDPVMYHLGAVMASNTLYPLFSVACSLMERAGVDPAMAPRMLLPLVRGSVENIARLGAARGMTGPIARADANTVERHLRALSTDPELRELYRALARRAVALAEEAGADPAGLQSIEILLEEP